MKVRCDREQIAHLQTALLHLAVWPLSMANVSASRGDQPHGSTP